MAWAQWSTWSDCPVSCGYGRVTRFRGCINGEVGDLGCLGEDIDARGCYERVDFLM